MPPSIYSRMTSTEKISQLEIVTARPTFHKELRDEDHDDLWTLQLRQLSLGSTVSTGHGSNEAEAAGFSRWEKPWENPDLVHRFTVNSQL